MLVLLVSLLIIRLATILYFLYLAGGGGCTNVYQLVKNLPLAAANQYYLLKELFFFIYACNCHSVLLMMLASLLLYELYNLLRILAVNRIFSQDLCLKLKRL